MHLIGARSSTLPLFGVKTLYVVHPRRRHMSIWQRGNSRLAVRNCGEAFWSQAAYALLEQASQVGYEMVELGEFVAYRDL
jgi:hypothetical protein